MSSSPSALTLAKHISPPWPRLLLTSVIAMQGSCSQEFSKRGALRLSRRVYSFKVASTATLYCNVKADVCISSSIRGGNVDGGAFCDLEVPVRSESAETTIKPRKFSDPVQGSSVARASDNLL